MDVSRIRDGLWRWTAPDPERPDREVGCVYYEREDGIVLIDPVAPTEGTPNADRFWRALDRDIARIGRPIKVLSTSDRRARCSGAIRHRYAGDPGVLVEAPDGVIAHAIPGRVDGEVAFWIDEHRVLVFGEAVSGGRLGSLRVKARFREGVKPLLDLPIAIVLVSRGAPVLAGGRDALEAALAPTQGVGQSET